MVRCITICAFVALVAGCSSSSSDSEDTWSAESQVLGKELADVGFTRRYVRQCIEGDRAVAVILVNRIVDHGGGLHTETIRQIHFRAMNVLRPGSDERGGSIFDYPWFALVPRPGVDASEVQEKGILLVTLTFSSQGWPESERVVVLEKADDPRVGELQRMIDEMASSKTHKRQPWER